MRPVLMGDVVAAARALMAVPPAARARLMAAMLAEAEAAEAYRRACGRAHPDWGNGSLMAVAMARARVAEPALSDPAYRDCLVAVLEALGGGGRAVFSSRRSFRVKGDAYLV